MIRFARPGEREALEAVMRRASLHWAAYRAQLIAHPEAIEVPAAALAQGRVRVALDTRARIAGFSVVEPVVDDAVELEGLCVEPDAMGTGIGRTLVEDLVRRAREEGATVVEVTAGPEGRGFYERVGFVAGEPVETRFGPALRMRRDV